MLTNHYLPLLAIAASILSLTACSSPSTSEPDPWSPVPEQSWDETSKLITFDISGAFNVHTESLSARTDNDTHTVTRASLATDNSIGITDLWLFDYDGNGTLLQQAHQSPSDPAFGKPQLKLSYGQHTLVIIAAKGETPTLTTSALSWARIKDTFTASCPVTVSASTDNSLPVTLTRAVGAVYLVMSDVIPANAHQITVTMQRSQSLSLPALTPSAATLSSVTNDFPQSWIGTTDKTMSVYTLCPSDALTTDVTIRITASDNSVLSEFTIPDVPVASNRKTVLTGEVFGRSDGFTVSINDTWDDDLNIGF